MGRQPTRATQARTTRQSITIKDNSSKAAKKSENVMVLRQKRASSPGNVAVAPRAKRTALGDVTNQVSKRQVAVPRKASKIQKVAEPTKEREESTSDRLGTVNERVGLAVEKVDEECEVTKETPVAKETPVTSVQHSLEAAKLNDSVRCSQDKTDKGLEGAWRDIDAEERLDPLFSSQYAPQIYEYMRTRERQFLLGSYMSDQEDISASMRAILVDWLIEVQENFELFHETLYLAVQLTDHYLAASQVRREYLQLIGATCMLIAAKFEELSPPLVDDFLYLCDDAYTHDDLLNMEREILKKINYDINMPVAYRFLRRLARAADATMETHTLARYISESTLQDYLFVTDCPSYIAAGSMYLAIRMKKLGPWTPTLEHYSGYKVEQLMPLVHRLNILLQSSLGQTATVRSKYSHEVFFKVATLPALEDVDADAIDAQAS